MRSQIVKYFLLFTLTVGFYSVMRIEFFLWHFHQLTQRSILEILWAFCVGVRFDCSAVAYLSALPLLASLIPWGNLRLSLRQQNVAQWGSFVVLQTPMAIVNLVDTAYVDFVGSRFTWDTLFLFGEVQGKLWSFLAPFLGLFWVNTIVLLAYLWLCWKSLQRMDAILARTRKTGQGHAFVGLALQNVALAFLAIVLVIVAARGGWQKRPLSFVHANVSPVPLLNHLVLNSTFTVLKSYSEAKLPRVQYYADSHVLLAHLNGGIVGASSLEGKRPPPPQNIVVMMLESFALEYTGAAGTPSYTPFLDRLARRSVYFPKAVANGRRSIEGVAAVMAGIPALMREPFISSQFASNTFVGLGTVLARQGYETAFFHGGKNGTMYFDSFMKSAGVEKYFGANEYPHPEDHDGAWGIWDEPFLQWTVHKMGEFKTPFMAAIFTLSSHQPFQIPAQYTERFPEGPLPILKAVQYADFALERFFASASRQPWYAHTLFILTADHAAMHFRPEFDNHIGNYQIPLVFFHPQRELPLGNTDQAVGQIDILPSIMDFLQVEHPVKNYLGRSVFVPGERATVNFIDGRYLIMTEKDWLVWSPVAGTALNASPRLYSLLDGAGTQALQDVSRTEWLVNRIKAHMQYFSEGMWDNRLYVSIHREAGEGQVSGEPGEYAFHGKAASQPSRQ